MALPKASGAAGHPPALTDQPPSGLQASPSGKADLIRFGGTCLISASSSTVFLARSTASEGMRASSAEEEASSQAMLLQPLAKATRYSGTSLNLLDQRSSRARARRQD